MGNIVDSLPQGIVWKEDISKWDKEVPLSPKDLLQALDEITTLTLFILGIEKGVPFFAEARKTKRWTSYWGISWLNLERSTITTIPPKKSKSIEIMAIFNGKKERITRHPPKNPRQKVTQQTPQKGGLVIQVGATNLSKGKSAQVGELSHLAGSVKKVNSAQVGDFTKFAQVEIKKFAQDGNLDFLPQDGNKNEKLAQVGNFAISPRKFAQDGNLDILPQNGDKIEKLAQVGNSTKSPRKFAQDGNLDFLPQDGGKNEKLAQVGNFKNLPKNSAPAPVRVTTLLKGQQPKSVSSVVVRQLNRTGDVGSNPPEVTISDEPRTGSTIDNYTVSQDLGRGFKSQKVKNFDPDWDIGDSEDSDEEDILAPEEQYRDKIGLPETNTQNFWWRQGITPTLPEEEAGIWRKKLVLSTKREETDLLKIVRLGLAKTTRAAHRRALKWMEGLPEPPPKMSIATWLLKSFSERQEERKWQGSTLTSYMASTQGALAHLQIYRNNLLPVILKSSSEWRMGLKGAGNIMRSSIPKQAAVLTHETLAIALKLEPSLKIRTALEVAWVTAGRGGDVIKLRSRDVESDPKGTRVRFVVGKTATNEPYTVATAKLSPEAAKYVADRKAEPGATQWLFPQVLGEHLKLALRRANPLLEQRSIRRGALQFLSGQGLGDEKLLVYSQHRSVQTLRRYLDFGWLSGEGEERSVAAEGLSIGKRPPSTS